MRCPYCQSAETQVLETREADGALRRRRACRGCEQRFTTYERVEALQLIVRKRDGSGQPFDREKLMRGLVRAAVKRPVSTTALGELVDSIAEQLAAAGGELPAEQIGELALRGLRDIDAVAYVRFASVYRNFADVGEFEAELHRLAGEPPLRRVSQSAAETARRETAQDAESGLGSIRVRGEDPRSAQLRPRRARTSPQAATITEE